MYYFRTLYTRRIASLVLLDALCLFAAAGLAWRVVEPEFSGLAYTAALLLAAGLAFLTFFFTDAYRPTVAARGQDTLLSIVIAMGLACPPILTIYFFASLPADVKPALAHTAAAYIPLLVATRLAVPALWRCQPFRRSVLIIGASDLGLQIAEILRRNEQCGIRVAGFLSDELAYQSHEAHFEGFPVLGKTHHLEKILDGGSIDIVVVASKNRSEQFPEEALQSAKVSGLQIESGIAFLERLAGTIYLRDLRPSYLIFSSGLSQGKLSIAVKRGIDIVVSGLGLLLASPLLLVSAIAIKLDSKGPVFFRQVRLGQHDQPFEMIKLRSMRVDAEQETGAVFTSQNDSRVTRVGQVLRPTRLDEVPQLWNVLRGEMSLVGPRAERPEFTQELKDRYRYFWMRSSVKPGLSGWAQTRYGYVNDVDSYEAKLALDLYYIKHRSLFMDLVVLAMTVKTVLRLRGL